MNVDEPKYNSRLWSLTDNQIWYYVTHFLESREAHKSITRLLAHAVPLTLSDTYVQLANVQIRAGQTAQARESLRRSLRYNAENRYAYESFQRLYEKLGDEAAARRSEAAARRLWRHPFQVFIRLPEIDVGQLEAAAKRLAE